MEMTTPTDILGTERIRRLKRVEYDRLAAEGFFEDERVELLFGMVLAMSPLDVAHNESTRRVHLALVRAIRDRARVFCQSSFAASEISEPEPDVVVVLDPTVMGAVDVTSGLKEDGIIIANTSYDAAALTKKYGLKNKLYIVNANKIAVEEIGRPITNTTMMGALVKATGLVDLASIEKQIEHRFPAIAEKNI